MGEKKWQTKLWTGLAPVERVLWNDTMSGLMIYAHAAYNQIKYAYMCSTIQQTRYEHNGKRW